MIRRDAIKSMGILTAGIVSGAMLITEIPTGRISVQDGLKLLPDDGISPLIHIGFRKCDGGIMNYIQHLNPNDIGSPPDEFKDILGDWQ